MSDLVAVLDNADASLVQSDVEEVDKLADEAKDLVAEDVGADRTAAVDQEHQVGGLLGTGGLHGANAARLEVGAAGDIDEAVVALASVAILCIDAVGVFIACIQLWTGALVAR